MAKKSSAKTPKAKTARKGTAAAAKARNRSPDTPRVDRRITAQHPGKSFDLIEAQATSALELASRHSAQVSPRLPAGLVSQLTSDLAALSDARSGQVASKVTAAASTAQQQSALGTAYARITAIHDGIEHAFSAKDVRKAWGVGVRISPKMATEVTAGIKLIVDRATAKPDEATAAGVLASDLDELRGYQTSLKGVHDDHRSARNTAPLTTAARNRLARTIDAAVGTISTAGVQAFAHDPVTRAAFAALRASGKGRGGSKGGGPSGTPAGTGTATPAAPDATAKKA